MSSRFSCPNCARSLPGPHAACADCGFPNHVRSQGGGPTVNTTTGRASLQFHLRTVLGVTLLAAIVARVFRAYGWDGIGLVLDLCAISAFPIEFLWQFWKNLSEPFPESRNTKISHPLDAEN